MTIDEMISRKKELGYSNKKLAELSGVPLGTVQRIFSGETQNPRYQALLALEKVLKYPEQGMLSEPASGYMDSYNSGTSALKSGGYTLDDYLALPDDQRVELIDGVFYDMASPTSVHQLIGGRIYAFLLSFVQENGGECIPFIAPMDVQLDCDDKTIVEPDVFVVCDRSKITRPRIVGAPDLVIEVMSSNWYHDTVRKLKKYKNAGVREYWIIMPEQKEVLVYFFEESDGPHYYSFEDKIPVRIWEGKCEVDFSTVYESVKFLYEKD